MTFQSFFVQCQTCSSRLRVTDPSLVDSIVMCPKCESMVQVTRPAEPQFALGTAPVDSDALTQDSIQSDLEEGQNQNPLGETQSGFQRPDSLNDESDNLEPSYEDADGDESEAWDTDPPAWESERTAKSRQVAMLVALSSAVLFASIVLFLVFIRGWNSSKVADADTGENGSPSAVADLDSMDESDGSQEPTGGADSDPDSTTNEADPTEANPFENHSPPEKSDADSTAANVFDNPKAESQDTVGTADPDQGMMPPADLLPGSPLEGPFASPLESNGLSSGLPGTDGQGESGDDDPAEQLMMELPAGLEIFDPDMFDREQAIPTAPAPPTLDQVQLDRPAVEKNNPTLIATPPEPINARRALGIQLALSVKNKTYPLNELTMMMSQYTGAPIHLEWVSFDLVKTEITQPIQVPRGWLKASETLEKIAEAVGGEVVIEDYVIRIQPTAERLDAAILALTDLSDLGDAVAPAVNEINQLLHGQTNESAPDRLIESPELGVRQLTALACEAMRRVRGVNGKLSDDSLFRWSVPLGHQRMEWSALAGQRSGRELYSADAAASLLRRISKQNGAACYVNWVDATRRRLSPVQKVMPYMGDSVDGATALKEALSPFGLSVRKVDEKHWWVGTDATYDQFPVIAWTDRLPDPDAFFAKFRVVLAAADGAKGNAILDEKSGRALLMVPRFLLRQLPEVMSDLVPLAQNP